MVSIIVPIYNNEISLKKCLDSILAQTYANWEAILVNDGSTDNTGKIIEEYAKKDSRFIAVCKRNEGTLLARKTGLENSKGEFIANIDHDDAYHPEFLEKMRRKIIESNADFAYCDYREMIENGKSAAADCEWSADASENAAKIFSSGGPACVLWNKLVKREIYEKVEFPSAHIIFGEDIIQTFQIAYHSKSAVFVPEILYFYKDGGLTAKTSLFDSSREISNVNSSIERFFNGAAPKSIRDSFYRRYDYCAYNYFKLSKKQRAAFKSNLEPFLPEIIKRIENFSLRICLSLALKGAELPFRLRERAKKYHSLFQF
jgi:glycosyltransferase involved in cell wall biosynthesis